MFAEVIASNGVRGMAETAELVPEDYIPLAIVVMGVTYNTINALLYGEIYLKATRLLILGQRLLLGIYSGVKN